MALTPSTMMPLGTKASDFSLLDVKTSRVVSLAELKSDIATVVMFICNHCPYVILIQPELVKLADKYQELGIQFIAISSNDVVNYPADGPDKMKAVALEYGYSFPYLYDESQDVARAYDAACTPDIFVFDKNLLCVYRGQFDEARPGNGIRVTGKDLSDALDCILAGKKVDQDQVASVGCNIKWKK